MCIALKLNYGIYSQRKSIKYHEELATSLTGEILFSEFDNVIELVDFEFEFRFLHGRMRCIQFISSRMNICGFVGRADRYVFRTQ